LSESETQNALFKILIENSVSKKKVASNGEINVGKMFAENWS